MSGSLAFDAAWLFAAFLAILVFAAGFLATRRFLLERGGGTVECGLRKGAGPWRLGVASYQLDELRWFNAFGISPRPDETFGRRDLAVVSRRTPDPAEEATLGPDRVIVECRLHSTTAEQRAAPADGTAPAAGGGAQAVELALADSALTGLLAWLEAAPPGSHLGRVQLTSPAGRPASTARPRAPRSPAATG